jgi:hypothetical protein
MRVGDSASNNVIALNADMSVLSLSLQRSVDTSETELRRIQRQGDRHHAIDDRSSMRLSKKLLSQAPPVDR